MPRSFENWARTVKTTPSRWARPTGVAEVQALVRDVAREGGRLRVAGSRHSWSPVAAADDGTVQVDLSALDHLVSLEPEAGLVTVEAGCTLSTLCAVLDRHGLALPILGSITAQTVAGATATATHGSSFHHGHLGTLITHARLVDGRGDVHEIGPDDPRFPALSPHLGALGILTHLTLKVVPAFQLCELRRRFPLDAALDGALDQIAAHDFGKLWWWPHADEASLFLYDRTESLGAPSRLARSVDAWMNRTVFPGILAAGKVVPAAIPWIQRTVDRVHFSEGEQVGPSHELLTLSLPPRHRETEWSVPLEAGPALLRTLRDRLRQTGERLDFLVELRVVAGDSGWMSPDHGTEPRCHVGVYGTHSRDIEGLFDFVAQEALAVGGRPHWAKAHQPSHQLTAEAFPAHDHFLEVVRALDPEGVFTNAFTQRAFSTTSPR